MAGLRGVRQVTRARAVARGAIAGVVIAATALAGCGDGDTLETEKSDRDSDLIVAAQKFGQAYLSGDSVALLELIEPTGSKQIEEEYSELVDSYGRPSGVVEVKNFGFEVTREDPLEADVSYSGQVCQPTLTNEFPETTVTGGAETETSTVNSGSIVVGEVTCADVRDAAPIFWQIEFVKVDGTWYGKLPGTT